MKTGILVTGIGSGGVGEQIVKALKIADRYKIIGSNTTPNIAVDVDSFHILPPASDNTYINKLQKLCKKLKIDVIIPGSEIELEIISKKRHKFSDYMLPIQPDKVIDICTNKLETMKFLRNNEFYHPRTLLVSGGANINTVKSWLPAVIKPVIGRGSNNVFIAQDMSEVSFFCNYLIKQNQIPLVQEYVGSYNEEYTIGILSTLDGCLIHTIILKRDVEGISRKLMVKKHTDRSNEIKVDRWAAKMNLKNNPLSENLVISSGISQGQFVSNSVIKDCCEKVSRTLGSKGPLNIQCRVVGDKVYIFEINPRFSGTSSLRAMAGFNEPDILIRHHFEKEPLQNYTHKNINIGRKLIEFIREEE